MEAFERRRAEKSAAKVAETIHLVTSDEEVTPQDDIEELEHGASEHAPQLVVAQTAFIVAWINGEVIISADLNSPIAVEHYPTQDEILGAAANLVADRTAERSASLAATNTVGLIEHKQREALGKMQAAQKVAQGQALLEAEKNGGHF